jgi:hypothetical protein
MDHALIGVDYSFIITEIIGGCFLTIDAFFFFITAVSGIIFKSNLIIAPRNQDWFVVPTPF